MIGYLLVLYLALVSVLHIDPNPLYTLPLAAVLIGFLFEKKWMGVAGWTGFVLISFWKLGSPNLTDIWSVSIHIIILVLPLIILLEAILSPRPYRLERIGIWPLVISIFLSAGAILLLFFLPRIQQIGIYLDSDPSLQIFIITAIAILFFGPVLLGPGPSDPARSSGPGQRTNTDKNE
ncbi:MAG TPA: hypothetical protein ENK47_08985 [Euryarchaeota archaeon]|nr:hypothetical protein [Euryarchaeota archaeon]